LAKTQKKETEWLGHGEHPFLIYGREWAKKKSDKEEDDERAFQRTLQEVERWNDRYSAWEKYVAGGGAAKLEEFDVDPQAATARLLLAPAQDPRAIANPVLAGIYRFLQSMVGNMVAKPQDMQNFEYRPRMAPGTEKALDFAGQTTGQLAQFITAAQLSGAATGALGNVPQLARLGQLAPEAIRAAGRGVATGVAREGLKALARLEAPTAKEAAGSIAFTAGAGAAGSAARQALESALPGIHPLIEAPIAGASAGVGGAAAAYPFSGKPVKEYAKETLPQIAAMAILETVMTTGSPATWKPKQEVSRAHNEFRQAEKRWEDAFKKGDDAASNAAYRDMMNAADKMWHYATRSGEYMARDKKVFIDNLRAAAVQKAARMGWQPGEAVQTQSAPALPPPDAEATTEVPAAPVLTVPTGTTPPPTPPRTPVPVVPESVTPPSPPAPPPSTPKVPVAATATDINELTAQRDQLQGDMYDYQQSIAKLQKTLKRGGMSKQQASMIVQDIRRFTAMRYEAERKLASINDELKVAGHDSPGASAAPAGFSLKINRGKSGQVSVNFPDQAHADLYNIGQAAAKSKSFVPAPVFVTKLKDTFGWDENVDVVSEARRYRDYVRPQIDALERGKAMDAPEYSAAQPVPAAPDVAQAPSPVQPVEPPTTTAALDVIEPPPEPPASESLVPTPPEDATPTSLLDQDGVPARMLTDEEKDAWQAGYNAAVTGTRGRAYPTQNLEEAYRAGYDWHRESSTARGDHRQALRDAVSKRLGVSGDTDIVDYIRKAVLDHARNNKPLPKGIYVVPTPMQAQKLADKLNTPLTALYIKDERDIHVGAWKSNLQGWDDWSGYVAEVPWDFSEWHRRDPAEKTNVYVVPAQTVASQVFTERPIPRYVIVPTQHTPGKDVPPMRAGARGGVRVEDWLEVKGIGGTAPKPPVPREYTGEPGIPIRYKPQKHLTGSGRYGLTRDGVTTHGGYDTWEEAVDAANRANRKAAETDRIVKEQERAERSKYPVLKWGKGEPDYIKLASRNEVGALRANLVGKIAQPYEHDSPVYLDKGKLVRIDNNEHRWNSGKYALHLVNPDDYGEHFQWSKHGERKAIAAGAYRKEALPSSPVTATPPVGEASSQPPTSPDAAAEDLMRSWKTERDQLVAKKYKNRGDEIRIERLTKMLAAKPEKWKLGDGVGHRVTRDQINRGFRIVDVDPLKKEVLIRQVADTGITVTGGDHDRIADQWVPIIDLVRDNRYNLRTPAPDWEPVAAPDAPKPTNLKSAYEQAIIRKGIIDLDNSPDGATQIRVVPLGDGYDVELHVKLPGQADIGAHRLSIVNDAPDILSTPTTLAGAQDKAVFLASSERARKNLIEKWREKHAPVASQETGVAMDTKPAGDADDVQDADPFDKLKVKPIEPVEMGWTDTASEPASADIPEGFDPVTLDQVKISGKPGKVTDGTGFTLEQKAHIADTLLKQRAPMTDAPLGKAAETGINRYAENRSETVKIEVPDDGTLRVVKSVEAIDTVLKKLGVKQSSEQNVRVPTILDKTEQWMILETPFGPAITDTKQLLPIDKEVYERLREGKARAAGYKGEVRDRGRELYDEVSALVSGNVEPLSVDRRVGSHLHGDELEAVVFKRGPEDEIHIAAKAFDHFVKQGAVKFESANGQVVIAKDGAGKILGVVSPYTYEAVSEGFGWTKQSEAEPTAPPLTTAPASGVQGAPKKPLSIEEMERKMADAVDAFIEEATPPAGLSVKVVQSSAPPKRPSGKSQYAFQDEEIEQRWQAARGVPKTGAIAKMIEWGHRLYNQANREFEHLPRTPRNEGIRFHLLKLQKQRGVVGDKTIRIQQGITVELSPEDADLFTRKVILDDLAREAAQGRNLPFGFTKEGLAAEKARIDEFASSNEKVKTAHAKRHEAWSAIREAYKTWGKTIGWNVGDKLDNEDYYRHQVLEYADVRYRFGTGRKVRTPSGRSYLRKRTGSDKDINTNYVQAEYEVMAGMLHDIEIMKTIHILNKYDYNIIESLKWKATEANRESLIEHFAKVVQQNDPETEGMSPEELRQLAEKEYRKALNWRQAKGYKELEWLAAHDSLPAGDNGEWQDVIDALTKAHAIRQVEPEPETGQKPDASLSKDEMKRLMQYMNWLMKSSAEEVAEGKGAASEVFKGMAYKKQYAKTVLGKSLKTWEDFIPEGYVEWDPKPGTTVYITDSIPERLARQLFEGTLAEAKITKEQIRKTMALGRQQKRYVIPEEIAATLDNLAEARPRNAVDDAARTLMRGWKKWVLASPRRVVKYNTRNLGSDGHISQVGNSSTFAKVPQAIKELYQVYAADRSMTPDMQDWFERGGMESNLSVQELGDLDKLRPLLHMMEVREKQGILGIPEKLWSAYWEKVDIATNFREAILRYAAYLDYMEQMKVNPDGKPKNFGASVPEEVMALRDIEDRAFKLSNELLGAYDQVSVLGKWLREHLIPFWSYQEINMRRWKQLILNAARDPDTASKAGKSLGVKGARAAFRVGSFVIKALGLQAMLMAYNYLLFRDEEEDLPEYVRDQAHIVLGRKKDGSVMYFDRLGALDDLFEWFGVDEWPSITRQYLNKRITLQQAIGEIAMSAPKSAFNKVVSGLSPIMKTTGEVIFKKSLYPNALQPTPIRDRGLHVAQALDVDKLYREIAGLPSKGYWKSFADIPVYSSDPGETAYFAIRDKSIEYQKKIGKYSAGYSENERSYALYNYKVALRYGDKDAATKYLNLYLAKGGSLKGLKQSLASMHPLGILANADRQGFINQLTPDEHRLFVKAMEYYEDAIAEAPEEAQPQPATAKSSAARPPKLKF